MALKVIDRFTTRDGSWTANNETFSITSIAEEKYQDCPFKGAATHIIIKAPSGTRVTCQTSDQKNATMFVVGQPNWINFPMFHSSAYNPGRGEKGPWEVWANGTLIADDIGLPYSWHVSTFLIVEDVAVSPTPPPISPPTNKPVSHIQILVDEVMVFDNWSKQ